MLFIQISFNGKWVATAQKDVSLPFVWLYVLYTYNLEIKRARADQGKATADGFVFLQKAIFRHTYKGLWAFLKSLLIHMLVWQVWESAPR